MAWAGPLVAAVLGGLTPEQQRSLLTYAIQYPKACPSARLAEVLVFFRISSIISYVAFSVLVFWCLGRELPNASTNPLPHRCCS
jgi:hypothetical protein